MYVNSFSLTYKKFIEKTVSAPVHPLVLIIVKTHENRVEHILAILQMT
jgi:hypothetical protein